MSHETYLHCIQSTLKVSKVLLKRSLEETRINNFNKTLLKCWEANLEIQFILDPYACVSYIVSYISKGQRGLSKLLFLCVNKDKEGHYRQMIMLFTKWRNEKVNLLHGCHMRKVI